MDESLNTLTLLVVVLVFLPLAKAYFWRPEWSVEDLDKTRNSFFDVAKGLAILAVVGIHAVDFYRIQLSEAGTELLFMNAFLRFAIPIFVIASGLLLDPKDLERGAVNFYSRKLKRIFIPYLIAVVVYFLFTEPWSLSALTWHIVRGDILVPYYFVVVLFALYLMYPLLVWMAKYRWFLPATFALSVIVALLHLRWAYGIPLPFEFVFFFAYGIAMRPLLYRDHAPVALWPWLLIGALYFGAFFAYPTYYYNAMFFWGITAFVLLFHFRDAVTAFTARIFQPLGKHSLWIFLIHYPLLFWIGNQALDVLEAAPTILGAVALTAVSLALSYGLAVAISYIARKIPFLK